MEVITTHFNADFDCMASMVAVQKLYPDAKMVFSGSMEKALQNFLKAFGYPFQFTKIKEVDFEKITLLVVVDTQDPNRIGPFKSLLNKKNIQVHVYDHHLDVANPIQAEKKFIMKRGSTTTMLCEMLAEKGINFSKTENTLMALGIYQDTHSLISPSTCPEDFFAVGQLVKNGVDLNVVADFVEAKLNRDQLEVMNILIGNLEIQNFNGVDIAISTATLENYIGDLAVVVYRLMQLENLGIMFAVLRLESRIYLIGRSRSDEVNVGHVLRHFGGGGHPNAASASIKELTLIETREKLNSILSEEVKPLELVKNIMHAPVITASAKNSVEEVEKKMTKFNLNSLPVVVGKKPVGLITRQIVEKALHHKLAKEPVEEIMIHEITVTTPDSYFKSIVPIIVEEKQKVIPVVHPKDGKLLGVVSRGDLLRILHKDLASYSTGSYAPLLQEKEYLVKNLKSLMTERMPREIMNLLAVTVKTANKMDCKVYAVGGFVRDLLLRVENLDIDIVVEGNGVEFAAALGDKLKGRVISHKKFGTSVVVLPNGYKIDVATARVEYYKHPAALPTVEKSSIKSDLFRRDFTFNSLAIKLNGSDAFNLIDFFNGQRDLKEKVVRVLHNLSFVEDPCRAFRAVRFEQRLKFSIGKQTESFIKRAVKKKLFDSLSGHRLFNELVLILKEKKVVECARRMNELGLLKSVLPQLAKGSKHFENLEKIQGILSLSNVVSLIPASEIWWVNFLGLTSNLDSKASSELIDRLKMTGKILRRFKKDREDYPKSLKALKKFKNPQPSDIYNLLREVSRESILFLMAISGNEAINKQLLLYITQYDSSADLFLDGEDLKNMGIKPGPLFKQVFKVLRDAKLDGVVRTREDEMALVNEKFIETP